MTLGSNHNFRAVLIAITFALNLLVAKAQNAPTTPSTFPFTLSNTGIPLVRVSLGNGRTALFAIDTGLNLGIISQDLVARLGLTIKLAVHDEDGKQMKDLQGNDIMAAILDECQLGELHLAQQPMWVMEPKRVSGFAQQPLDGVIGELILSKFAMLIDYQKQQITLWPGGNVSEAERTRIGMDHAFSSRFEDPTHSFHFTTPVQVNRGETCQCLVDTGAWHTEIPTRIANHLKLIPLVRNLTQQTDLGIEHIDCAQVKSIAVGDCTLHNAQVSYYSDNSKEVFSILGYDFLAQFRVLLDYPAHRMYFKSAIRQRISVPWVHVDNDRGLPLVQVVLKDGKPHVFGIEPKRLTCVDVKLAQMLQSEPQFARGEPIIVSSFSLANGEIHSSSFSFHVKDLSDIRQALPFVEGCLGRDLLANYAVGMDFTKHEFTFWSPGHLEQSDLVAATGQSIPLTLADAGYQLTVEVDDQKAPFMASFLGETLIDVGDLAAALHPKRSLDERADKLVSRQLRLDHLGVGNLLWKDPVVADGSIHPHAQGNTLGSDYWRQFKAIFDFHGQALYLQPDPDYPSAQNKWVATGMVPSFSEDGRMMVTSLLVPSPAQEAGIQVGDEIVAVNGLVIKDNSVASVFQEFGKPAGVEITLTVRSKGEEKTREVKLKRRRLL